MDDIIHLFFVKGHTFDCKQILRCGLQNQKDKHAVVVEHKDGKCETIHFEDKKEAEEFVKEFVSELETTNITAEAFKRFDCLYCFAKEATACQQCGSQAFCETCFARGIRCYDCNEAQPPRYNLRSRKAS